MKLLRRLRYLLRQRREARELTEEIEHHHALTEVAQRAAGLPEAEARAAARRLMGNATLAREDARRVWLAAWIESVFQDLRYAARSLAAQPGFTFMALLALVLGIGLNTSLFTVVNTILYRPWNVPEPERVVKLWTLGPRSSSSGFPLAGARFLNQNSRTVEGVFATREYFFALDDADNVPPARVQFVQGDFFGLLRIPTQLGRALTSGDSVPGAPVPVAVLSDFQWRQRYGADPGMVGRTIRLDGAPFTVIGVASKSFAGTGEERTDLWVPFTSLALARENDPSVSALLTDPGVCCSETAARLRPGVSRAQAQAELNALYQQYRTGLNRADPLAVVLTGTSMLDEPGKRGEASLALGLLLVAVGSILLLACANVSNLQLARAAARQREIAVRVAIGAGRGRVVRQLMTESLLLAGLAGGGGLLLAYVLPGWVLRVMTPLGAPTNIDFTPDRNVVGYALAAAVISAIAFGLAPALQGTRAGVGEVLKQHGAPTGPRVPLRGFLLGMQVAISVALLAAAGLLLRGVDRARAFDVGFRVAGVTGVQVSLPANSYDAVQHRVFFEELLGSLRAAGPAAVAERIPLGTSSSFNDFVVSGVPAERLRSVLEQQVTAGYFDLLQMPILTGRGFTSGDRERGAILVNESLARLYWEGRSPVGETVRIGKRVREIVGVVGDAQLRRVGPTEPVFFAPFEQTSPLEPPVVLVPSSMAPTVVAAVRVAEPRANTQVIELQDQMERSLGDSVGIARIAGALGLLALLLATVGVYGVISYSVEQRRREIGVRMALGAQPGQVVGLVLRRNARAVLIGLAAGLSIAVGESVVLKSELYGLSPLDPLAYAGVLALLLAAGCAASVIPARRAVRTDPVRALHED